MARRKKIIIIAAVVLLLGGGGGAAWYILAKPADSKKHPAPKEQSAPVFVKLDTFTVNMADTDADRYLQVDINIRVADPVQQDVLKENMPELRNRILLLLTSKQSEELKTQEGKQKLAEQIKEIGNRLLQQLGHKAGVIDVYFNSFIIQ